MRWDKEPAAARLKQQDKSLRAYLVHELYPFSPYYRAKFDEAGVQPRTLKTLADLARYPFTEWSDVRASPFELVLRPDEESIAHYGNRRLVLAVTRAKLRGGTGEVNRDVIDRAYKPIHWHLDDGDVPVGYTYEDVERLAEAGHRVLAVAGMTRYDVLVTVTAPEPSLAHWQIVFGAQIAGVSALHLGHAVDGALVVAAAPTVLAGSSSELLTVLTDLEDGGRKLPDLHLLLVVGELPDDTTRDLLRASGRAVGKKELDVVAAYAPPGVRSLWTHCRGGDAFHTYPDLEWLEVVDPSGRAVDSEGELVWTGVGWHGTAMFRLRTGITAVARDDTCPTCQRIGVRLYTAGGRAPQPVRTPSDAVEWLTETVTDDKLPAPSRAAARAVSVQAPPPAPPPPVSMSAASDDDFDEGEAVEEDEFEDEEIDDEEFEGEEIAASEDEEDEYEDEEEEELVPVASAPAFEAREPVTVRAPLAVTIPEELEVLRDHDGVAAWQAEYRWVGDDEELLVFLAPAQSGHPGPLCREIDRVLQATQYVIMAREAVATRVARDGLIVDLRD